MNDELQLRDFIRKLWRQKWWLMLATLLVMAGTAWVSLKLPKVYRATATLVPPEIDQAWPTPDGLKTRFGAAAVGGAIRPGTTATDVIMGMLKSRRIALAVIEKFDLRTVYPAEAWFKLPRLPGQEGDDSPKLGDILEELRNRTDIRITRESLLSISVEDRDPKRATAMVQCYLDELARVNTELQTTYNQYLARVLDPPMVPDKKTKPRVLLNTLIGGAATVFLWMAVLFCRLNLTGEPAPARRDAVETRPRQVATT